MQAWPVVLQQAEQEAVEADAMLSAALEGYRQWLSEAEGLGQYFSDGCTLSNAAADLSTIPDGVFAGYVVDTGRCFPYFAKYSYCSICLPVCAYNHKAWARDFDGFQTKLFPTVVMEVAPPAVDLPDVHVLHVYPKLAR